MRIPALTALVVLAFSTAACETGPGYGSGPYAGGGAYGGGSSQLSSCQRNALLGAAGGALLGGITAGKGVKTEGAVLGAAVGGLGVYGVCRYLDQQSVSRVETGYQSSLNQDRPYESSWNGPNGDESLYVPAPTSAGANCKRLQATLTTPSGGQQPLPPETYCRGGDGQWRPS